MAGVVPPHHQDPPASVSGGNILDIPEAGWGGKQRRKSRSRISDRRRMGLTPSTPREVEGGQRNRGKNGHL